MSGSTPLCYADLAHEEIRVDITLFGRIRKRRSQTCKMTDSSLFFKVF